MKASVLMFALFLGGISLQAAVYLKADSPGGADGQTFDGTSWSTAYKTLAEAVAKQSETGEPIYAAGGVYYQDAKLTFTRSFVIYGGFPGVSESEGLEDRDFSYTGNATIITQTYSNNAKWTRYFQDPDSAYSLKTEKTDTLIISEEGRINLPPAFTGDWDTFGTSAANSKGSLIFTVSSGAYVDNVVFTGFGYNANGSIFVISSTTAPTEIIGCTFIGNASRGGILNGGGKATLTDCKFLFNRQESTVCSCVSLTGSATLDNCLFYGNTGSSGGASGAVVHLAGGKVIGCTFVRNIVKMSDSLSAGVIKFNGDSGTMSDTAITNNLLLTTGTTPFVYAQTERFTRCLFENNRVEFKPGANTGYGFIIVHYTTYRVLGLDGCVLRNNVLHASDSTATEGSFVTVGMIGNHKEGQRFETVNCTFDSNVIELPEMPGVTVVKSRGLALTGYLATETGLQAAAANCVFTGPVQEGVYDIVQYGAGHVQNLDVVNCIFSTDADVANPFYADVPGLWRVINCSIKNLQGDGTTGGVDVTAGLETDEVALETVADANGFLHLRPAAKPDSVVGGTDVGLASAAVPNKYQYRNADGKWTKFLDYYNTTAPLATPTAIEDALGNVRTLGTLRRGPVDVLSDVAENGATLVLRRDPFAAGTVSAANPAVAAGGTVSGIWAAPIGGANFSGWYDEDGVLYSDKAEISAGPLPAGVTVLTARFSTKATELTFDLQGKGVFADTGLSTWTISVPAHSAMPQPPEVRETGNWHFVGWPGVPLEVPTEDTTYAAAFVSKDVRVVYLTPEGAGKMDGTSWENAYGDFASAYADAGLYRGEVWMKKGFYLFRDAVPMIPNVTLRGGFAGTESAAEEADPKANLTVITGDAFGDNTWSGPSAGGRLVWENGVLNEPNPDGVDVCWKPVGQQATDTQWAFNTDAGAVTNCAFRGLVFTGFFDGVIHTTAGGTGTLVIDGCKFVANGTHQNKSDVRVVLLTDSPLIMRNTVFAGNFFPLWLNGSSQAYTNVIEDCEFGNSSGSQQCAALRADGNSAIQVKRTRFHHNWNDNLNTGAAAALGLQQNGCKVDSLIEDCVFERNTAQGECHGVVYFQVGKQIKFVRCRFDANSVTNGAASQYNGVCTCMAADTAVFDRCSFTGNSLYSTASAGRHASAICASAGASVLRLYDCTFDGNEIFSGNAGAAVGTVVMNHHNAYLAAVNCVMKGAVFTGAAASSCADIRVEEESATANYGSTFLGLLNTIVWGEGEGYRGVYATGASTNTVMTFADVCIADYDDEKYGAMFAAPTASNNGYCYNVTSENPKFKAGAVGPNGIYAVGIAADSPVARTGRPVYLGNNGGRYFRDAVVGASKRWRNVANRNSYMTDAAAAAIGVSTTSTPIADAWAQTRHKRHPSLGPLQTPLPGLMLLMR